jgi:hypothetical protein
MERNVESRLTIKSGMILALAAGILAWGFQTAMTHERRITVLETQNVNLVTTLNSLNSNICEIKNDLKEHQKQTVEFRDRGR